MPYAEINDTRLHIRQQGTGSVALFVHGFPLDSSMWIEQLADLCDLRRCIAPDLRGFGRSAPVTGAPLTMEEHAADLAGVLDLVSEEQADVVGLSMGGYVPHRGFGTLPRLHQMDRADACGVLSGLGDTTYPDSVRFGDRRLGR